MRCEQTEKLYDDILIETNCVVNWLKNGAQIYQIDDFISKKRCKNNHRYIRFDICYSIYNSRIIYGLYSIQVSRKKRRKKKKSEKNTSCAALEMKILFFRYVSFC